MSQQLKPEKTFYGQVNGIIFKDRESMNNYISDCVVNGVAIDNLSYSYQETYKPAVPETTKPEKSPVKKKLSWTNYINQINSIVPAPYNSVIGYVIPFIKEDCDIADTNAHNNIIADLKTKLENRMVFLEKYVFSAINDDYDKAQVNEWLSLLADGLNKKLAWANNRCNDIDTLLNSISNDKFFTDNVDTLYFNTFYTIYHEVAGYCAALIDIIMDKTK